MDRAIAMSDLSRLSKQKAITVADIEAPNVISLTASQVGWGWWFISYFLELSILIGMGGWVHGVIIFNCFKLLLMFCFNA
jgi:hypothetical protein